MEELQRQRLRNVTNHSNKFYNIVIEKYDDKAAPYLVKGEYGPIGREHRPTTVNAGWYEVLSHAKLHAEKIFREKTKKGYVLHAEEFSTASKVRVATSRFDFDEE